MGSVGIEPTKATSPDLLLNHQTIRPRLAGYLPIGSVTKRVEGATAGMVNPQDSTNDDPQGFHPVTVVTG
jgi:hypothetical protein